MLEQLENNKDTTIEGVRLRSTRERDTERVMETKSDGNTG